MSRTQPWLVLLLLAAPAFAHKGSDGYWRLAASGTELHGRLDVAIRDLHLVVPLDANADGAITFAELDAGDAAARGWLLRGLAIRQSAAPCSLTLGAVAVVHHSDGVYASWPMSAKCLQPITTVTLEYALLFDVDAQHRGLVQLSGAAGGQWHSFSTTSRSLQLDATPPPLGTQTRRAFLEGLHHLAIGWDHLCFLCALLLPSALRREGGQWRPRPTLRGTLGDVAKVVTAFTVAHSLTLALSAFGVLAPNAAAVEVAIAFSVVLAALNTVFPVITEDRWSLAFGLGLLHGFGFVSALADLGAAGASRWLSVLGFNLGVEAGQLIGVALFVPLAFLVRRTTWYPRLVPVIGFALTVLAARWTFERL